MDTDALKAFIAVEKSRSFSLAAQSLFLTQPAISKRIAALESQLNHTLFDRLGKEVALTEAGEALLPKAKEILQSMSDAERSIRELSGEIVGTLRVATSHHVGLHHLPPVLREFAAQHPNVNLRFEFLDSEKAHEKIIKGECDMGVVTLPPKLESPLIGETLWNDPLVFVAGKSHPLRSLKTAGLSTLSETPAILPDLNTYTGRLVKACFDEADLPLRLNMSTNYLETIKMMVSVGLGWSLLPKTLVDEQMIELNVPGVVLHRELGVITNQKRSLANAARAFYDMLINTAKQ